MKKIPTEVVVGTIVVLALSIPVGMILFLLLAFVPIKYAYLMIPVFLCDLATVIYYVKIKPRHKKLMQPWQIILILTFSVIIIFVGICLFAIALSPIFIGISAIILSIGTMMYLIAYMHMSHLPPWGRVRR